MSKPTIRFELDIAGIATAIDSGGLQGLRLAGDVVTAEAKARAPQRTGQLVNSIQAQPPEGSFVDGTASITIGAGAPYATYVEFGTGVHGPRGQQTLVKKHQRNTRWGPVTVDAYYTDGMRAQPYLVPAIEDNTDMIEDILASAIDNALDKVGR
jgi:HK97 gp10 family phage protein